MHVFELERPKLISRVKYRLEFPPTYLVRACSLARGHHWLMSPRWIISTHGEDGVFSLWHFEHFGSLLVFKHKVFIILDRDRFELPGYSPYNGRLFGYGSPRVGDKSTFIFFLFQFPLIPLVQERAALAGVPVLIDVISCECSWLIIRQIFLGEHH